jgi:hypothetical protein
VGAPMKSEAYIEWCQETVDASKEVLTIIPNALILSKKQKKQWIDAANKTIAKYSKDLK